MDTTPHTSLDPYASVSTESRIRSNLYFCAFLPLTAGTQVLGAEDPQTSEAVSRVGKSTLVGEAESKEPPPRTLVAREPPGGWQD